MRRRTWLMIGTGVTLLDLSLGCFTATSKAQEESASLTSGGSEATGQQAYDDFFTSDDSTETSVPMEQEDDLPFPLPSTAQEDAAGDAFTDDDLPFWQPPDTSLEPPQIAPLSGLIPVQPPLVQPPRSSGKKVSPRGAGWKRLKLTLPHQLSAAEVDELQSHLPDWIEKPPVVLREGWGADAPPPVSAGVGEYPTRTIVLHHTDGGPSAGHSIASYLHGVETDHIRRHFPGIGYHALIGADARVYEGFRRRGSDGSHFLQDGPKAAHSRKFNEGSYGIAVIGNYEKRDFDLDGRVGQTLLKTITYVATRPGRTQFDYYDGALWMKTVAIIGHNQTGLSQTDCPGPSITAQLPEIARRVQSRVEKSIVQHEEELHWETA